MATPAAAIVELRRIINDEWLKSDAMMEARKQLVASAKRGHAEIMTKAKAEGNEPTWTAYGDAEGTAIEDAKWKIVYTYAYTSDIVAAILKELRDASPVDSGRYRRSHGLYINGAPVPSTTPLGAAQKAGQRVAVANPLPYARRLEVGKTESGRDFLISKPNKIYERATARLQGRFRNMVKLRFGYIAMPNAHVIKGKLSSYYGLPHISPIARRKRKQEVGREVRAPAIFIERL